MATARWPLVALLALGAVLFFANTWGYDLWPPDEPRFGEVPREMMQTGNYLVPFCNGEPYKEKPPLLFWAIAAASWPVGDVTEFTARVPSGVAALLTVLFTYLLAARLYNRRVALWSALMLMTMGLFWLEARSARTDMLLTACMTGALLSFWRWHEDRRVVWLAAFYGAIVLGLYAKGPPALVFPILLIAAFYWKRSTDRRRTHWAIGVLIAVALVLVWFIPARMALPVTVSEGVHVGIGKEALRQIVGRLVTGGSKAEWPWYYLWNVPLCMLPWTLFLPWVLPWVWRRRREDDRMRLLLAWTVPALIFFSISVGKRNMYVLPLYPAFAILTARAVLDLAESDRAAWRKRTGFVWGLFLLGLGAAPFGLLFSPYRDMWNNSLLVFSGCAIAFGAYTLFQARRTDFRALHVALAGQFAVLALTVAMFLFPAVNHYKGASDFCRPLSELARKGTDYRLYSIGFSREEYIFYARHFHRTLLTEWIPLKLSRPVDPRAVAQQELRLRKAIAKAAKTAPVAAPLAPTDAEIRALRAAEHQAIEAAGVDPELAQAFEAALTDVVARFAKELDQPLPAYFFIQEDDWKWLAGFFPRLGRLELVARETVGQRNVLLVANAAGAAAVAAL